MKRGEGVADAELETFLQPQQFLLSFTMS